MCALAFLHLTNETKQITLSVAKISAQIQSIPAQTIPAQTIPAQTIPAPPVTLQPEVEGPQVSKLDWTIDPSKEMQEE